jgi:cytochrome bd-type quinol oxidase subunit 2
LAETIRQPVRLFFVPLLYVASVVPVFFVLIAATVVMEEQIALHRYNSEGLIGFYGNIALLASFLVVACPIFGMTNWLIRRLEGETRSSVLDHVRRCAFLYASVPVLSVVAVIEYLKNLAAGYSDAKPDTMVLLVVGCAIVVDALMVIRRRGFVGSSSGAVT